MEFLSLRQGNMSVTEYLDKFTHLSRYAPDEVNTDPKRQERFLDGLIGPLNYQLQSHIFSRLPDTGEQGNWAGEQEEGNG
jgi:hypothetical protein